MNENYLKTFTNLNFSPPSPGEGLIIHRKIKILNINQTLAAMFGYDYSVLKDGEFTILDLIESELRSLVLKNTLIKYDRPYEAVGLRKDGSTFSITILDQPLAGQDTSVRTMTITTGQKDPLEIAQGLQKTRQNLEEELDRTTTQLRFANERLQLELDERSQIEADLRVRARQQAAVAELGQRALAGTEQAILFSDAVISAAHILDVPYAALFECSPDEDKFVLQAGVGWPANLIGQATVELNPDNPMGYVFNTGEPVMIAEPEIETRFKRPSLLRGHHLVGGLNLAIRGSKQSYGVLGVYTTDHRHFTEDDLHFLQAFANILAATIERSQAELQIRASMQEKEVLLREIHHRVKNNLQLILSLLSLQAGYLGQTQPEKLIHDIQGRVHSMALIHEKLYRAENLARIDFKEYTTDLVAHLFRMHHSTAGNIVFDLKTDPLSLSIDTAVSCGLIINELVTNALTHAFPNGRSGEVRIEFSQNGHDRLNLRVTDDGIGMPITFDVEESGSLGLKVVNSLVHQLEGTMERLPDPGTAFKISFPSDQEE